MFNTKYFHQKSHWTQLEIEVTWEKKRVKCKTDTIHGVERFMVLCWGSERSQTTKMHVCGHLHSGCFSLISIVRCTTSKERPPKGTFSVFRQAALSLSCYGLSQGVQTDFSSIQQESIHLLFVHRFHYYTVKSLLSRTIFNLNIIVCSISCMGFRRRYHGLIFFK